MTLYFIRVAPTWLLLMAMIGGCGNQTSSQSDDGVTLIKDRHTDLPARVVYRIDDYRFVSLENYDKCYGDVYYNDTQKYIHTKVFESDPVHYRGRLIIDDPTGMNIVIPENTGSCSDRGCPSLATYSTDGGQTFAWIHYREHGFELSKDSESDTIAVTKDRFYVKERWGANDAYVSEYPLIPRIDLKKPYPPGVRGSSFAESDRPRFLDGLHTPSGDDHFTCDESIRPSNLPQKKP